MKLLVATAAFIAVSIAHPAAAQTTIDLDWSLGSGPSLDASISVGDTVRWTWTDAAPHTAESTTGTESFNSGLLTGIGQTFSHTFTAEGSTDYKCGIHGAATMGGTITVTEAPPAGLGVLSGKEKFKVGPNCGPAVKSFVAIDFVVASNGTWVANIGA